MVTPAFKIVNGKAVREALSGVSDRLKNTGPMMMLIGRSMQTATARRWMRSTGPDGSKWKPTGKLALMSRPGGGVRGKTLLSNGRLFRSVTSRVPQPNQIFATTDTTAIIGTNVRYARIQQEGGVIRPVRAKRLAIPMSREAAIAGSARAWWSRAEAAGRKPFIPPSGKYIATSNQRRTTLHFLLLLKVTLPPRPFLGIAKEDIVPMAKLVAGFVLKDSARRSPSA